MADNNKLILVAEDDEYYANIYRTKLVKEGFRVIIAGNGAEALKLAKENKPDLILLDVIMPVMDGFVTLSKLKEDSELKDIRVVILSNLGQAEDVKKAKSLGAYDYIVKSNLSISEMMEKINGFLTLHQVFSG